MGGIEDETISGMREMKVHSQIIWGWKNRPINYSDNSQLNGVKRSMLIWLVLLLLNFHDHIILLR